MAPRILEDTATEPVANDDAARPDESKADAFRRLANKRVTVAMDKIRLVSNLSSRGNYEYTDAQVEAIETALLYSVQECMKQFRKGAKNKPQFSL